MTKKVFPRLEVELAVKDALPQRKGAVMLLNARGCSSKQIADCMDVSVATVNWHLDELKSQFGATNKADLASQGWMQGLFRARMLAWALMAFAMVPAVRSRPAPVNGTRPPVVRNIIGRTPVRSIYG